ncbi:hypothetical protein B0H13DRAFT_1904070 [Mycena leptocephala]|nr:hypothetical protein B0H13DRAFT_1904070 [Mycena leptocephala]
MASPSEGGKCCLKDLETLRGDYVAPGLITILELRRRQQQQQRGTVLNSILSRKAVHLSAVEPYGVFKCKIKLRRESLTLRNENRSETEGRGYARRGAAEFPSENLA